jgi:hypothetical protein
MIQQPLDIAKDYYYYHRYLHPEMPVSCVTTTTDVIFDKKIDIIRMNRAAIYQFLKILYMEIIHKQSLMVNLCR